MAHEIRSNLFHKAASLIKEFGEHLAIVWDYTRREQKLILKHLPATIAAVTQRDRMVAVESFADDIGGDSHNAVKAMQVVIAIGDMWSPIRDTVKVALQDIQGLDVLPTDPQLRKRALAFSTSLFKFLEKDSDRRLRRSAAGAALRNMLGLSTTIDCRLIIDSEFDWREDDTTKYKPTCRGTVAVAILRFKLDEGDPVVFQCDAEDIGMIVRQLQATEKELKLAGTVCSKR